jgi:hypothetical protein
VTDFSIDPGAVAPRSTPVFSQLNRDGFADKLWARHTDLWSSDYGVGRRSRTASGGSMQLEFAPRSCRACRRSCAAFARSVHRRRAVRHGWSSLAPEVFHRLFGRDGTLPRFSMLDSTDPAAVRDRAEPARTLPSSSLRASPGTTIEPNSMAAPRGAASKRQV